MGLVIAFKVLATSLAITLFTTVPRALIHVKIEHPYIDACLNPYVAFVVVFLIIMLFIFSLALGTVSGVGSLILGCIAGIIVAIVYTIFLFFPEVIIEMISTIHLMPFIGSFI